MNVCIYISDSIPLLQYQYSIEESPEEEGQGNSGCFKQASEDNILGSQREETLHIKLNRVASPSLLMESIACVIEGVYWEMVRLSTVRVKASDRCMTATYFPSIAGGC